MALKRQRPQCALCGAFLKQMVRDPDPNAPRPYSTTCGRCGTKWYNEASDHRGPKR